MNQPSHPATLRYATADDVPVVLELIRDLAEYEKRRDDVVATEDDLRDVLFGEWPFAEVILAEVEGNTVGFALFFQNLSTFQGCRGLFLEDLYVRPEARGRGIGRQLLGRFAQIAQERRCGLLEWRALTWNEPAIAWYKSLGAFAIDEWNAYRVTGDDIDRMASYDAGE